MSELTVKMVKITPEVAANYLKFNTKNRKDKAKHINFLANQMISGDFLENGESIVFDFNGALLDGQHRLKAIIKSGLSYNIPIVRGAKPLSLATYDTGKNRSASDILDLNGFKYSGHLSILIKSINSYSLKGRKNSEFASKSREEGLTNQQVLEYCQENYEWLSPMIIECSKISNKSTTNVMQSTRMALISYMIGGKTPDAEVYEFIKNLVGVNLQESTAPNYLFTKLYNAKVNKDPLNFYWVLGMSLRAWNFYTDGNPAIRSFRFKVTDKLPTPLAAKNELFF